MNREAVIGSRRRLHRNTKLTHKEQKIPVVEHKRTKKKENRTARETLKPDTGRLNFFHHEKYNSSHAFKKKNNLVHAL